MKRTLLLLTMAVLSAFTGFGQAPAAAPATPAPAAAPAPPAPVALTVDDLKSIPVPSAEDRAKGDTGGDKTGNASDVAVSDPKAGLTLADLVNQVGQNKVGINFTWTLICGFMVMFMQAGFALVETGLIRAKNANHTMMMNFMVYGAGMLAYWFIGFAIQMGGAGALANLGGTPTLTSEFTATVFGKTMGFWGSKGLMLDGHYDVGGLLVFLFQMVFMDTALTIVTGTAAERWKFTAFLACSVVMGAFTYPIFANWAWGGGFLATLGTNFGLGHGYADFAGSGVVHSVGGLSALGMGILVGPRLGKYTRDGKPLAMPGHDITMVLAGCFILAFGWFGFNPGSTLGASGNGNLRITSVAVDTMLAGMAGGFVAMFYMWFRYGKPDASMSGNGLLAGLVAITAPSGFVSTTSSVIIGLIAGFLVCLSVEYVEKVMKIDDPVGAISVHGACGLWGVIAVGLFADGRSNYGGSWNGVPGAVTGLFYGDMGQLVAQLIGVATLVGVVFTLNFLISWVIDLTIGQRVSAEVELQGLDIPEMGAVAYPEFELKTM